jgi:hypothetical protein
MEIARQHFAQNLQTMWPKKKPRHTEGRGGGPKLRNYQRTDHSIEPCMFDARFVSGVD